MRRIVLLLAFTPVGCGADAASPLADAASKLAHDDGLSAAIPIFSVRDLKASQRYYRDALGFTVEWEDGDPPDFGAVARDHARVFMCQGCQGIPGAWIMVFTPNVDELHAELGERGAIIERAPTNMPWNLREMLVRDQDGNAIRFAGPIEH
jgi:catechol 2,3-dioxygenase-like lactoylglutathione lyase family enzyme